MNSRLSSGEMYNPDTKMWTALPDMMVPRSNHSLAVVQGRLVVIGGYQRTETTSKVEVLDSGQVFQHLGGGGGRSRLPGYLIWQVRRRVVCLPLNGLASTLE
jgi:hypothetical protein